MPSPEEHSGYQESFLGHGDLSIPILPIIDRSKYDLTELIDHPGQFVLDYHNYSVIMDEKRKFPILTAANIDGSMIKILKDKEGVKGWKKDPRINESFQWGTDLYEAEKSDFDKGHMAKRKDVQWGADKETAVKAAKSTFYYTNAIPQHLRLNRAIWKSIEHYILEKEAVKHQLKITVLTGPVLDDLNPEFVTPVKGEIIKIPILFWKIIYYTQGNGQLFRTAFLVSQKELLERNGIVKKSPNTRSTRGGDDPQRFLSYKNAATYQIEVEVIEKLTGLTFPAAGEKFKDTRYIRRILKEVITRGDEEITIKNLIL